MTILNVEGVRKRHPMGTQPPTPQFLNKSFVIVTRFVHPSGRVIVHAYGPYWLRHLAKRAADVLYAHMKLTHPDVDLEITVTTLIPEKR